MIVAAGAGFWFGQQRATPAGAAAAPGTAAPAPGKSAGGPGAAGGAAVEAVKVTTAQLSKTITAVGSLRSDESITVRPEVAGRVAFIGFQEGQRVPKGATLLRLDPAINQAEVQQAQANLTLAKAKYERAVELQGKGFVSGQARDEAENNLKVGEAALALANARLAKTEIKAPFTGVIGLRSGFRRGHRYERAGGDPAHGADAREHVADVAGDVRPNRAEQRAEPLDARRARLGQHTCADVHVVRRGALLAQPVVEVLRHLGRRLVPRNALPLARAALTDALHRVEESIGLVHHLAVLGALVAAARVRVGQVRRQLRVRR